MSWLEWHRASEVEAVAAHDLRRRGLYDNAELQFALAASHEQRALELVDSSKERTVSILAVSAVALWYKAREYQSAERLAVSALASMRLAGFARKQLQELLQAIWTEASMRDAGISLLPGQVTVSVSGGEVVVGAAPLDLIVEKVQTIQAMFYRTVEFLKGVEFRTRGAPRPEIQNACRPWIFQAAPGSYQFSVALREPEQPSLLEDDVNPREVAAHFLKIVRASAAGEGAALEEAVPEPKYRSTFLKLARNLVPNGRVFSKLEIRAVGEEATATFTPDSRVMINETLRPMSAQLLVGPDRNETVSGVLRAVHLDQGWIEIVQGTEALRIRTAGNAVDDVIGPMVNKKVAVRVERYRRQLRFIDIEVEE